MKLKSLIKVFHRGEKDVTMVTEEKLSPLNEEPTKAEERPETTGVEPLIEHQSHAVQTEALQLIPEVMWGKYNVVRKDKTGNTLPVDKAEEESQEQAPLFDTGPYEVSVDDKDVVVSKRSSAKARQVAQQPQIKLFDLGEGPAANVVTEEKPSLLEQEPAKEEERSEAPGAEPLTEHVISHAVQSDVLRLIPEVIARRYDAVPLAISDNTLEVAMADPANTVAIQVLSALTRMKIEPIAADAEEVRETIDLIYKKTCGEIEKQLTVT